MIAFLGCFIKLSKEVRISIGIGFSLIESPFCTINFMFIKDRRILEIFKEVKKNFKDPLPTISLFRKVPELSSKNWKVLRSKNSLYYISYKYKKYNDTFHITVYSKSEDKIKELLHWLEDNFGV